MVAYTLEEPSEQQERVIIPEDTTVEVRIVSVKEEKKPYQDDNGNDVYKNVWRFRITDGEFENRLVFGETGIKFVNHPDCKFFAWVGSVYGTVPPVGFKFNSDELEGMPCRLVVGVKEYTKKGETEVRQSNFVKDVFPPKGGSSRALEEEPF